MADISRRRLLKMGCVGALGALCGKVLGNPAGSPNILLIVADDLGYGDVSCYGGAGGIDTPYIDALAASGTLFTNGYACSSVCMPARIGMMTGVHPGRLGFHFNVPKAIAKPSRDIPMLSETLGAQGYHTGCIGKWGVGTEEGFTPNARGFEFFYGFDEGFYNYRGAVQRLHCNGRTVAPQRFTTPAFTQTAVRFIRQASLPWFLLLSYRAPHAPYHPEPAHLREFAHLPSPRREYAASVRALDNGVGSVLRALRESGQQENTLVVFLSDNGGAANPPGASCNAPLRGTKADVYEGGVRVPFIVRYPWDEGARVRHDPVSTLDIVPTALALAGVDIPVALDGYSTVGLPVTNRLLHWQLRVSQPAAPRTGAGRVPFHAWAIRQGRWKLVHGFQLN